jgi:hypothetical protein
MSDDIAIGTTLYVFDHNRRRYDSDQRIIYREHFYAVTIVGETRKSWIAGEGYAEEKISKADLTINRSPYGRLRAYTARAMEEDIWLHENRNRITENVRGSDYGTLRAIDDLIAARLKEGVA